MKKNYLEPSIEVVMLDQRDLIATSDPTVVSLGFSLEDVEQEGYAD